MNQPAIDYEGFLRSKSQLGGDHGFEPVFMPDALFDFQAHLTTWAIKRGRGAIFADCGLGKTLMQLVWAENVVRHTNRPVLIMTPLAVGAQTKREGEKFGIECVRSQDGKFPPGACIVITNYERLHYFDPGDFIGAVCDESSILKNFDGVRKDQITEFMRSLPYRLLCTATAGPNDYFELGTSSEALGELGYSDMLNRFFKRDQKFFRVDGMGGQGWRFRGHAERDFWRWVCSWARAIRKPSDMGFEDGRFILPELRTREHIVSAKTPREGFLLTLPAISLEEQREERRRTLNERCEMAASIVNQTSYPCVCWCHLNSEGNLLNRLIPDAEEVYGSEPDERKEELLEAFHDGHLRVLVTKPTIAGHGLNWQHCAHQTFFPSHSFEQWYQAVRRSWRFGQTRPVVIDVIASEGEKNVLANLRRKEDAADRMFSQLVTLMGNELRVKNVTRFHQPEVLPAWL